MVLWLKLLVYVVVCKLVMSTSWEYCWLVVCWIGLPQLRLSHSMLDRLFDQESLHTPPHLLPTHTLTCPQQPLVRFTTMLSVVGTTKGKKTQQLRLVRRWTEKESIHKNLLCGFGGIKSPYLSMLPWQQSFFALHSSSCSQTGRLCCLSIYKLHSKYRSSSAH